MSGYLTRQALAAVKTKKLTGTTAGTEGGSATIAHGLTADKILSVDVHVEYAADTYIPASYDDAAALKFNYQWDGTNITVTNKAADSANILNKPIVAVVSYEG